MEKDTMKVWPCTQRLFITLRSLLNSLEIACSRLWDKVYFLVEETSPPTLHPVPPSFILWYRTKYDCLLENSLSTFALISIMVFWPSKTRVCHKTVSANLSLPRLLVCPVSLELDLTNWVRNVTHRLVFWTYSHTCRTTLEAVEPFRSDAWLKVVTHGGGPLKGKLGLGSGLCLPASFLPEMNELLPHALDAVDRVIATIMPSPPWYPKSSCITCFYNAVTKMTHISK